MKHFFTFVVAFAAIVISAHAQQNRTPIHRGFLQDNLDANGQSITNASSVVASNFTGNAINLTNFPPLTNAIAYGAGANYPLEVFGDNGLLIVNSAGQIKASITGNGAFSGNGSQLTGITPAQVGAQPASSALTNLANGNGSALTHLQAANIDAGGTYSAGNGSQLTQLNGAQVSLASVTASGVITSNQFNYQLVQPMGSRSVACRLPPMGIEPWYLYGPSLAETNIMAQIDILSTNSYAGAGWRYIVIDDGWNIGRNASGHLIADTNKWTTWTTNSGFSNLTWYAHSKGVKLGIYTEDRPSCNWSVSGTDPTHFQIDAYDFASWGFDYVKFDLTSQADDETLVQHELQFANYWYGAPANSTNRQVWLQSGGMRNLDPRLMEVCTRARPSGLSANLGDNNSWSIFTNWVSALNQFKHLNMPNHFVDGDHVWTGSPSGTNYDQSMLSMYAMFSAPLFTHAAETKLGHPVNYGEMLNLDMLSIDQDPACIPPVLISSNANGQVYSKRLSTGKIAVALFNPDENNTHSLGFSWQNIGYDPAVTLSLLDVWSQTTWTASGSYTNTIGKATVQLLIVTPVVTAGTKVWRYAPWSVSSGCTALAPSSNESSSPVSAGSGYAIAGSASTQFILLDVPGNTTNVTGTLYASSSVDNQWSFTFQAFSTPPGAVGRWVTYTSANSNVVVSANTSVAVPFTVNFDATSGHESDIEQIRIFVNTATNTSGTRYIQSPIGLFCQ